MTIPASSGPPPGKRRRYRPWLWAVGVTLYLVVLTLVGWEHVWDAYQRLRPLPLAGLSGALIAALWLRALKWRIVLGREAGAFRLYFLSRLAGAWTPMRLGEFSPMLLRRHRTPRMGAWILLDRLLEITATLSMGALGFAGLGIGMRSFLPLMAAGTFVAMLLAGYLLTRRRLFLWLAERVREGGIIHRAALFAAAVSEELLKLRRMLLPIGVLTLVAMAFELGAGMLVYGSFGYPISFAVAAAATCAHGLTSMVPFAPNPTGLPHLAAAGVLHQFGGVPFPVLAAAAPVALSLNAAVFWVSVGVVMAKSAPKDAEPEEPPA